MKRIFLTSILLMATFLVFNSFSQELVWYSWDEGYQKAKDENKIMLVDAYTDWCGWCKVMDSKTYSDDEVISLIEGDFIPIKLNPEKPGTYEFNDTNYSGKNLIVFLSDGSFQGYPTTFFVNPENNEKGVEVGYKDAEAFKLILNKYIAE